MRSYLIRRLLLIPPTLIGVTIIVSIITRLVPGGPLDQAIAAATSMGGEMSGVSGQGADIALSEEQLEELKKYYNLDKPWHIAYIRWLGDLLTGDLGESFIHHEPVTKVIADRLPVSMFFGITTLIITYLVCIPLGVFKGVKHNSVFDNGTSVFVFMGYAIPNYVLGMLLFVYFGRELGWFPMTGFTSEGFEDFSTFEKVVDILHHSAMPLACYLIGSFAFTTFLMKNHLMDNLAADYVRTAVSKGVPFSKAVTRHAFRNSLIPIATNLGHQVTVLIAGSFLIETIFDIDGFGYLGFKSIVDRDYPVVMGILFLTASLTLLGNILSDILVALVDPRVRFQ